MNTNLEMARILRQARVDAGLTQLEVADILGIHRSTYHRAEAGTRWFSSDWVEKLPQPMQGPMARYLEVVCLRQAQEMRAVIDRLNHVKRRFKRPNSMPLAETSAAAAG